MPSYATQAQFEAYVEGWVTTDAAALARLLERASRDIDRAIGTGWPPTTYGLKFGNINGDNQYKLRADQIGALQRATCAQAEYRNEMGERFFVRGQHSSVSGPEFSTSGKLPRFSPKARDELAGAGLALTGARAGP